MKTLIVYASMSGNTEMIADLIEESLQNEGVHVERKEALDLEANDMLSYDYILLGAYTWGDGELPDDFLDIYEGIGELDFSGKKAAVFGSGDRAYEHFCGAVDLLEHRIAERGGELIVEGLKIEHAPYGEDIEQCRQFAKEFAEKIGVKTV